MDDELAVRAEGERFVPLIEAGVYRFDGTFCDFRPDLAWESAFVMPGRLGPTTRMN
ncbi:hypothetical protein GCM10009682_21710 [Luedemannella flava]|uniref:Uncharacterized protein n=1 Tax=Luedemannella flava TaxID=349316 RepID=A0ABN2LUG2_9ACTN